MCAQLLVEPPHDIGPPLDLGHLLGRVLVDEVVDVEEAAANPNIYLVALLNFDVYLPLPEGVDALRLAQEEDLHLFFLGILIYKLSQSLIHLVVLVRDVEA